MCASSNCHDSAIEGQDNETSDVSPGDSFVACQFDIKGWLGLVKVRSDEFDDYFINFMNRCNQAKQYFFPDKEDTCWRDKINILCTIQCPVIISTRGYSFIKSDINLSQDIFNPKSK